MSTEPAISNLPASPRSLAELRSLRKPVKNINIQREESLTPMNKLAVWITERVGTMGFFFLIFGWTVVWCGYNIIASEVTGLRWKAFDPFPAFVAYLLISNVIQILLMPLIMVGQNVQARHADLRAENDFEINCKAEMEIEVILMHLEHQQELLMQLVQSQSAKLDSALAEQEEGARPQLSGGSTAVKAVS